MAADDTFRVDPTRNVLDLVAAAISRQDDLRDITARHQEQLLDMQAKHAEQLREAESKRLDAIRAVDVGAVNRAAEVASQQATTLAAQVAVSAETLRAQVIAAATASAVALTAALEPIQKDIADLRRVQYEAVGGKTQVVEQRRTGDTSRSWVGLVAAAAIGFASLVLSAAAIVVTLLIR